MTPTDGSDLRKLRHLAHGFIIARAIYVAANLGVADQLKGGGDRVQNLAIALEVKPRPLYRVLRVLAGEGIFKEDPNEHFSLTPMGRLLCDDAPDSLRSYIVMNHEITYPVLNDLMHSLSDDEPILTRTFGQPIFEYLEDHPDRFALFQAAMTAANHAWDPMIAEA